MLFSVSRSLVQTKREKPVKYCGSDGEESSLEAGEVCDVEAGVRRRIRKHEKRSQGGAQIVGEFVSRGRMMQGGVRRGSGGHRPEVLHTLDSLPPPGVSQPSDDDDQHHLCMMCMDLNSRLDPFVDVFIGVLFITV